MALAVSVVLAALELGLLPALVEPRPALWVSMRTGGGFDGALAGGGRLYRLQPEVIVGLLTRPGFEVYAGAGLGPAYLVRSNGRGVQPSASGVLACRFSVQGGHTLSFLARAEGVAGGGGAVSFDVRLTFDPSPGR